MFIHKSRIAVDCSILSKNPMNNVKLGKKRAQDARVVENVLYVK